MRKHRVTAFALFILVTVAAAGFLFSQEDMEGCKDHPLFSRMKNFCLHNCESRFDAVEFYISENETMAPEGQKTILSYTIIDEGPHPSSLQIKRNYQNAFKSLGGTVLYENEDYFSGKLVKGNREVWMSVQVYNGGADYVLSILEVADMAQEVSAGEMLDALNRDGFIALYINFETGKSDILPGSMPIIEQIIRLLDENPELKVGIEGHTDNVGSAAFNKTLSEKRAQSVLKAVVDGGIEASRLSAVGWGPDRPIADNRSEDGRAKNRRVEITKK